MKTLEVLKKILVQESAILLNELSSGIKKTMFDKFKQETNDSDNDITGVINSFEKYQQSLEPSQRDITRYSYEDLKSLVKEKESEKESKKEKETIISYFKKVMGGTVDPTLKKTVKYFNEIKDELSEKDLNFKNFKNFESFKEMVQSNYSKIIYDKISKKIKNIDENILLASISFFTENMFSIPIEAKSLLNFKNEQEFEYFFDDLYRTFGQTKKSDYSGEEKYSNIKKIYNKDNLLVFEPETKEQCVRLGSDKSSWCISRPPQDSNYYYSYRFGKMGKERTMYFVFDLNEKEPINKYFVILVDDDTNYYLADITNSGNFSGSRITSWDTVVKKIPRIKNLRNLFVWRPFSEEELIMVNSLQNISSSEVGENPIEYFNRIAEQANKKPEEVTGMWLEIGSPTLTTEQYLNLTSDLMKKYLSYAKDRNITKEMISGSPSTVRSYYINKRFEHIKNSPIKDLTPSDFVLLKLNLPKMKELRLQKIKELSDSIKNTPNKLSSNEVEFLLLPEMATIKNSMRKEIISSISEFNTNSVEIKLPNAEITKVIRLYPDYNIFETIPKSVQTINIENNDKNLNIAIDIPDNIGNFTELRVLTLRRVLKSLPKTIVNCKNLEFFSISDNPNLVKLPESLLEMESVKWVDLADLPNLDKRSEEIKKILIIKYA